MVMAGSATSLLVVVVVVMVMVGAQAFSPPRPRRDYCRNRTPSECCRGVRDDHCEVETEDGFCYCDDFCMERYEFKEKKSSHTDCCPDFREVCLGEVPVPEERWLNNTHEHKKSTEETVCYYNDMILKEGKHIFNCNECLCQDSKITCEEDKCLVDEEILGQMKRPDPRLLDWKMTNYSMFWGRKVKEGLPLRTGTLPPDVLMSRMKPIPLRPDIQRILMKFDARVKPEWSGLISGVRDQGWCGASWVFSTLDVTQDRQRILSGASHGSLSTQEVLSCVAPRMECTGGGYISNAWGYIRRHGVMEETCYLYESGNTSTVPACHHKANCKKYKTEPAYRISEKVEDIQWEIMNEGPVQAVMRVYPDFFMYQSGVYHCPKNSDSDTATSSQHSVRIVGWGVHYTNKYNPLKYWVVANSWGTEWGERGFFRIQRGTNECHIESFVLATRGWKNPWLNTATRTQSQGIFATPQ